MISYLHCYVNDRPNVDWNTCGQAAIATISDYWGRNPYGLPRVERDGWNGRYYWDDGQAIDAIKNGGFGPDVVFGWGTTGGRVRDALRSYGLNAVVGHSGAFSWGRSATSLPIMRRARWWSFRQRIAPRPVRPSRPATARDSDGQVDNAPRQGSPGAGDLAFERASRAAVVDA